MQKLSEKIKLLYGPFLAISIGFIIIYTFLHWILFIYWSVFPVKEDILDIWLPLFLPWLPILIWLRKKTKFIPLKKGSDKPRFGFQAIAWLTMAIPAVIAQQYIETATGKMTRIETISQLNQQQATKYYTLRSYYIDKSAAAVYGSSEVTGKHSETLNFHLHMVMPIYKDSTDTVCTAWLGIKYYKSYSNHMSGDEREAAWQDFAKSSEDDFDKKDVQQFMYLERAGNNDDHDNFNKALAKSTRPNINGTTILLPINEPFDARNGNKLAWVFGSFTIGAFFFLFVLFFVKLDEGEIEKYHAGVRETNTDGKDFFRLFVPRENFFATPVIMDINILVFLIMVCCGLGFVSFPSGELLKWGANYGPATKNGQWWRLLTSTFLHGGAMHLLANMFGLVFAGIFLEPVIGKMKFAIAYVLTGIIASLTSLWWHDATISVGASGAIFGIYGVFLALLLTRIFPKDFSKPFLLSTLVFVGYNLLAGLAGGIDNAAHIGGLLSGFFLGFILLPGLKQQTKDEYLSELKNEDEHTEDH